MRIGVLGTGMVGQAIVGGNPPFKVWHEQHPDVELQTPMFNFKVVR